MTGRLWQILRQLYHTVRQIVRHCAKHCDQSCGGGPSDMAHRSLHHNDSWLEKDEKPESSLQSPRARERARPLESQLSQLMSTRDLRRRWKNWRSAMNGLDSICSKSEEKSSSFGRKEVSWCCLAALPQRG